MKWIEEIKQINWKHTRWSELWRRNTFDRWQHNTTTTTTFGRTTEKKYRRKICCRFVGPPQHRVSVRFFFFSFGFFFVRPFIHTRVFVRVSAAGFLISRVELYKRLRRRPWGCVLLKVIRRKVLVLIHGVLPPIILERIPSWRYRQTLITLSAVNL